MFTWVCPTCGRELDLATKQCPNCTAESGATAAPDTAEAASKRRFWMILAGGTVAAIVALILVARYKSQPPARVEPAGSATLSLPVIASSSSPSRQLEVSGIRMSYDSQNKARVRAVVINHGEESIRDLTLEVTLRSSQSAKDSPALARFSVKISKELKPGDSIEIKAPLDAFGTLASMPPWNQLRIDLE